MTVFVFCDPPDLSFFFFFLHFIFRCTLYPSSHPLIFQTCFKVFLFFCCSSKSLCKQRGWNNSYGNRDAFGCNTAGCSPSAILPLCSREFPEHAAGERDTLPARSLVPLAFSWAFSLFVCRAALLFYFFFSENHLVATVFFFFAFSQFLNDTSFLLCTARMYFLFFPSFFFLHSKNRS